MREIKFRLRIDNKIVGYERWYKGNECGYQVENASCSASPCWLYSKDGKYWNPTYVYHKQKDQYTGLFDKNWKEIYEGDIVKFDYSDEQNGYSGNQQVKFAEFEAGFHPFCLRSRWRASVDNIEIIGNIYENPELLIQMEE